MPRTIRPLARARGSSIRPLSSPVAGRVVVADAPSEMRNCGERPSSGVSATFRNSPFVNAISPYLVGRRRNASGPGAPARGTNVVLTDGPPSYQFPGVPRVRSCSGRRPVLLATVLGLLIPLGAAAALLPGGGPRRTDCFALLDVESPLPLGGLRKASCVDGDPNCDADSMCDGTCQFTVRLCVNDEGVDGCQPPESLRSVTVGKGLVPVPETLVGSACGAPAAVTVPVRGPLLRQRPGRLAIRVKARGRGSDVDRFVLTCIPRLGTCPPPTTTTTFAPSTTTSTSTTRPPTTTTTPRRATDRHHVVEHDDDERRDHVDHRRDDHVDHVVEHDLHHHVHVDDDHNDDPTDDHHDHDHNDVADDHHDDDVADHHHDRTPRPPPLRQRRPRRPCRPPPR